MPVTIPAVAFLRHDGAPATVQGRSFSVNRETLRDAMLAYADEIAASINGTPWEGVAFQVHLGALFTHCGDETLGPPD